MCSSATCLSAGWFTFLEGYLSKVRSVVGGVIVQGGAGGVCCWGGFKIEIV